MLDSNRKYSCIYESCILAFYVFWLISFPMEGPLLLFFAHYKIINFILPHIISLLFSSKFLRAPIWNKFSLICTLLVALLTLLFPIFIYEKSILILFIGFFSGPVVLRVLSILSKSSNLLLSIGTGLAVGNTFVIILNFLQIDIFLKFLIIALLLLPIVFKSPSEIKETDLKDLKLKLPFIYFFYLIGGLLYGFLMVEYKKNAIADNVELLFYVIFALIGIYLIRKNKEFILASGIFLGMLAFSFFKIGDISSVNISMFLIQASFAFVDFYLISTLIENGFNIKRVSYGLSTMCLALISGEMISIYFDNAINYLILFGNIILTLSVFIFYFFRETNYKKFKEPEDKETVMENYKSEENKNSSMKIEKIISSYPVKFSPKEKEVLRHLLEGKTYKQIALIVQISESSVKTYVRRIGEKIGVQGRDSIVRALMENKDIQE